MKAALWETYGKPADALRFSDADQPRPKSNEVLIKVHASTVTAGDARIRALNVPQGFRLLTRLAFGWFKPRKTIPGMEFSGVVKFVGNGVKSFKAGDRVFGSTGMQLGAHAEYLCLPEKAVMVKLPVEISHQEAVASLFGGLTAIHFLKQKAQLKAGQTILINGASGSVGTASIQVAKYLGANITAVCSTGNMKLVKSLGANQVIDYTQTDLDAISAEFDFILDAVGNLPLSRCQNMLKERGKVIAIVADLPTNISAIFNAKLISGVAWENKANLTFLKIQVLNGDFNPVVDRVYPIEHIVKAHEYVDTGHKKGSVVITMDD
ncbi:NAD(P)-dependent alcohol dehydrogenase [Marinicella meishanensis]|uniref:NAD(P)-dependent alcohol dehydrogenase n=1 Tax=Marinicella meishanensis TaxID=2873263 RepID=UPI001CBE24D9|nr:NAD(P)-dependent alcohol dehydrogenase [Marinicella sp. NBU2979]